MKKIYTFVTALFIGASAQAQYVVDFETHNLSGAETFDNGVGGTGNFIFGNSADISLTNVYDTAWGGSWSGFSISNITDAVTAGFGNQYSSFTGSGAGNSNNYAVYYNEGQFGANATQAVKIDSFKITNTTYAGLSMKFGDSFSKKFGSPLNADGDPDGTNGEDFFRVWIVGEDYFGNQDSLELYLADYRFLDSTQDYILDKWINIDLTSFNFVVNTVHFRFESSDMGQWGMNTPAYCAVDDVSYGSVLGTDFSETLSVSVYPNPVVDLLTIKGEEGTVFITDVNGGLICSFEHEDVSHTDFSQLPSGVYFIRIITADGQSVKKIVK